MSLDCLLSIWYLVEPRRVGRAVWQLRRLLITRSHPCPSHRGSGGWCYSLAPMVLTLLVELYSIWYESIPVLWGGVRAIWFTTSAPVNRSGLPPRTPGIVICGSLRTPYQDLVFFSTLMLFHDKGLIHMSLQPCVFVLSRLSPMTVVSVHVASMYVFRYFRDDEYLTDKEGGAVDEGGSCVGVCRIKLFFRYDEYLTDKEGGAVDEVDSCVGVCRIKLHVRRFSSQACCGRGQRL